MSAHCLSVSVVRASNQPHPHTMHGFPGSILTAGRAHCSLATSAGTRKEWSAGTGKITRGGFECPQALVLGHYIETNEELPTPGPLTGGQELVTVRPPFAAKLALYAAMRRQNITLDDLADRLGLSAADVEEMLDPCIHSSISRITGALQAAGCRLVVEDLTADGGEHICYPALTRGNLRMSYREFIRRVRRYALVND